MAYLHIHKGITSILITTNTNSLAADWVLFAQDGETLNDTESELSKPFPLTAPTASPGKSTPTTAEESSKEGDVGGWFKTHKDTEKSLKMLLRSSTQCNCTYISVEHLIKNVLLCMFFTLLVLYLRPPKLGTKTLPKLEGTKTKTY